MKLSSKGTRAGMRLACLAALILPLLSPAARAGLVIEIDPTIDVSGIHSLRVEDGNLIVRMGADTKRIELPAGALEQVAIWATRGAEGPLVFSIDGALVSNVSNNYFPPTTPEDLAHALLDYDVYAHQVGSGATPLDLAAHPLVADKGEAALPHRRYAALIDSANESDKAVVVPAPGRQARAAALRRGTALAARKALEQGLSRRTRGR